jgi:hypothetical protein
MTFFCYQELRDERKSTSISLHHHQSDTEELEQKEKKNIK